MYCISIVLWINLTSPLVPQRPHLIWFIHLGLPMKLHPALLCLAIGLAYL